MMRVRNLWLAALLASLAVILINVCFAVSQARHWTPVDVPGLEVRNPVIAMELAPPPLLEVMIAAGGNRAEMSRQQYIDYFYMAAYLALFMLIAILESHSPRRWIAALGPLSVVLILIAVNYDLIENRAILAVTERGEPSAWPAIREASLVKWTCVFLTVLLQAPFYWTVEIRGAILARIIGAAALLAGLGGTGCAMLGNEKGIEQSAIPMLVAVLAMPLFFWLGRKNCQFEPAVGAV